MSLLSATQSKTVFRNNDSGSGRGCFELPKAKKSPLSGDFFSFICIYAKNVVLLQIVLGMNAKSD
jgi:hypothetical protein